MLGWVLFAAVVVIVLRIVGARERRARKQHEEAVAQINPIEPFRKSVRQTPVPRPFKPAPLDELIKRRPVAITKSPAIPPHAVERMNTGTAGFIARGRETFDPWATYSTTSGMMSGMVMTSHDNVSAMFDQTNFRDRHGRSAYEIERQRHIDRIRSTTRKVIQENFAAPGDTFYADGDTKATRDARAQAVRDFLEKGIRR